MAENQSQIPWFRYWNETANPAPPFQVDDACIIALRMLNLRGEKRSAMEHFGGCQLACNPDTHPDATVIANWLTSNGRGLSELPAIFWLAFFVRNEWGNFPKRTNAEHRELYERIAKLCSELRDAMDETGLPYLDGEGGLKAINIFAMLTDNEIRSIPSASDHARDLPDIPRDLNAEQRRMLGMLLSLPVAGLPTLGTLLDRVAAQARQLDSLGPLHSQPNKRGAERGYFVRRMGALLERRYGEQPHEVIAALTTIALGEETDRELVAKLLAPRTL